MPRLQFRLRSLFILTAIVGWGAATVPYWTGRFCEYRQAVRIAEKDEKDREKALAAHRKSDEIMRQNWLRYEATLDAIFPQRKRE